MCLVSVTPGGEAVSPYAAGGWHAEGRAGNIWMEWFWQNLFEIWPGNLLEDRLTGW